MFTRKKNMNKFKIKDFKDKQTHNSTRNTTSYKLKAEQNEPHQILVRWLT